MSISISDQKHFNDLLFFPLHSNGSATMAATHGMEHDNDATQPRSTRRVFAKRISKSTFKNKKSVSKSWHTYEYTHTVVCLQCAWANIVEWSVLPCIIFWWRWAILRVIDCVLIRAKDFVQALPQSPFRFDHNRRIVWLTIRIQMAVLMCFIFFISFVVHYSTLILR